MSEYACWRITGELLNSIESCPAGSLDDCMHLVEGDTCLSGMQIKL